MNNSLFLLEKIDQALILCNSGNDVSLHITQYSRPVYIRPANTLVDGIIYRENVALKISVAIQKADVERSV